MIKTTLAAGLLSIMLALPFSGISSVPQAKDLTQKDEAVRLKADLVLVPVAVTTKKTGLPASGLGKEDFVLFDEGVPQEIVFFGQDDIPLSLLLLVESRFIEDVARAARVIVSRLKPEDEVAIMVFHGNPCLVQKLTKQKDAAFDILEQLAPQERNRELVQPNNARITGPATRGPVHPLVGPRAARPG